MLKLLMADTGAARADPLASALPSVLAHALLPVRAPSSQERLRANPRPRARDGLPLSSSSLRT